MNVLSLFDGISCARVALERAGIQIKTYYSSEIEKNAIKASQKNWKDIVQLGDVRTIDSKDLPKIDLLIGGSPCVDLSIAKKDRKGLEGSRSSLFWEYVRLRKELNPTYFLLENVASMPKKDKDIITKEMGVEPVLFNASLVSAQCRKRLFWTNIRFELPEDKGIVLKDILEEDVEERYYLRGVFRATAQTGRNETKKLGFVGDNDHQAKRVYADDGKSPALNVVCNSLVKREIQNLRENTEKAKCLTSSTYKGSQNNGMTLVKSGEDILPNRIRKLTPIECERLQSLPDNYTEGISVSQRYKVLGNAFNVDVVAHILRKIIVDENK